MAAPSPSTSTGPCPTSTTRSRLGFGAVPNPVDHPGVDTGERYDTAPWSDGPYVIDYFKAGIGGSLILKRNPYWNPATDDYRGAYPDEWDVQFGVDPKVLDQRMIQPTGNDRWAVAYGNMQPANLSTVFTDSHTANSDFAGRAFSDYDPYVSYYWIDTEKVPSQQVRQAMAVALDRDAIRAAYPTGEFKGDFADGVLKPNIGIDYAPTHLWDASGPFGQDIPPTGESRPRRQLIQQSGTSAPTLTWDYMSSPMTDQIAGIIQDSLQKAGFSVKLAPVVGCYTYICPPVNHEFGAAGWGADWPNASTVIPTLFTPAGGYDMSQVSSDNYPAFESAVADAMTTLDRQQQALKWQALDQRSVGPSIRHPHVLGPAAEHRRAGRRQPVSLGAVQLVAVRPVVREAVDAPPRKHSGRPNLWASLGLLVGVSGALTMEAMPRATVSPVSEDVEGFYSAAAPHIDKMRRVAARLAGAANRDDVVQDALLQAWRARGQFDHDRGTFSAWLLAITAHQATRVRRRLRVAFQRRPDVSTSPDEGIDLRAAIARLPPRERLAVDCFYFADLSIVETAAVMRCSEGTVKSTLSSAREHLRELMR